MQEISFFENKNVIVTQTRFIVAHKVVEIKNILAVKTRSVRVYRALKLVLALIGFLLIFFNAWRIPGIILFFVSILSVYFTEEKYSVHLNTKSGETDSLISKDRDYIEQVVKAINYAMWAYHLKTAPM
ncbi:DUF6232 family protein [uncultured Mucilaginibacter sp.]|uniref:DUF6232 family protein n=1 Tax=uncultured Mucilaginibacter sp. TaxID=797541 RepID=UPI0025F52172|nr:DUF6232 family protein [uncultured Mucilaginibacter sp.]